MLTIHNLTFGYNARPILNIPEFTLKPNTNLLIQGNSGSGKTSLLFLLAGFLKPTSGTITLNETNLQKLSSSQQDTFRGGTLGFVFQQPHLMAPLSVLQNLLVASSMAGKRPDEPHALALLRSLDIEDLAHRKPHQLSQGQMQRVAIARALVNKPQFMLADEPTSALDDTATEQVITLLLHTAKASGAQVIVTSHDARLKPHFPQVLNLNKAH
jgi:putative ABC transport system ATP-binding protein